MAGTTKAAEKAVQEPVEAKVEANVEVKEDAKKGKVYKLRSSNKYLTVSSLAFSIYTLIKLSFSVLSLEIPSIILTLSKLSIGLPP